MPLYAISLAYLFLPLWIFLFGWLRAPVAVAFAVLLGATGWAMRRELGGRIAIGWRRAALAALVALAWTALSGVSGFGHRNPDWPKHDAVLKGVVQESWPVVYEMEAAGLRGDRHGLVFYLAHYLPAGAIGKLFGWNCANLALALWTAGGVWLVLCWFAHLVGASGAAAGALLLFVFASGVDAIGTVAGSAALFGPTTHLEFWSGDWQYSSDTTLLFWAPHQALGGWLVTALLLHGLSKGEGSRSAPVEIAGALLWSPFVALGAVPIAVAGLVRSARPALRFWPNWLTAPAIGGLFVVYFAALRQESLPASFQGQRIVGELSGRYLLFVVLEFGLVWCLVRPRPADGTGPSSGRSVWWVTGLVLLAVPFVRLGHYNDFVMRVSIPALFVLWVLAGRALLDRERSAPARAALLSLLLLGAVTPLTEMARSVVGYRIDLPELASTADLPVAHGQIELARQYVGPPDALFFRYLARSRPPESR